MELHEYQKRIANFIQLHRRCVLSVDMGLGKTAAVLAWLDWYQRKAEYQKRVLIIAPKRVAENQWLQEAEKWGLVQLAKRMVIVAGTAKKKALALADNERPIKIISRDNVKDVKGADIDVLIIDELTSFKTVTSGRSKAVLSIDAERRIGLTGTFLANGAIDIFGQCAAVGLKWSSMNFYAWRATYFRDALSGSGLQFSKWKLNVPLIDVLKPVQGDVFTLTAADYLTIPPVTETTHEVMLAEETIQAVKDLDSFLFAELNGKVLSFDEKAKFAKLQTLCDGFVYTENGAVQRGTDSAKLRAVVDLVEDCKNAGEPVLLFYAFREEAVWLMEMLKERGIGGVDVRERNALERWNAGTIDCLLAHPASAGHGLNLQYGGRIIVWSTLTYNYEYFAQANARLARQGQKRNVQIHYFIAAGTCEKRVVKALREKDTEQKDFLKLTRK